MIAKTIARALNGRKAGGGMQTLSENRLNSYIRGAEEISVTAIFPCKMNTLHKNRSNAVVESMSGRRFTQRNS